MVSDVLFKPHSLFQHKKRGSQVDLCFLFNGRVLGSDDASQEAPSEIEFNGACCEYALGFGNGFFLKLWGAPNDWLVHETPYVLLV